MPNQERKRKKWDTESMKLAVAAVKEKRMGYLKASRIYGVPRSTLENYVNNKEKDVNELISTRLGRKCVLGEELERELLQYCIKMEERFYGVTLRDIKQLAFQLTVNNNMEHPFAQSKGAMALARAKGFTKLNVNMFYDLLEPELKKINMKPNKVFNVDETGISVVQSRRSKVLAVKGKKQIGTLSSQERGALMTGIFVPPLIAFPRKNMKPELLNGCPPEIIARCHQSGWLQAHIFTDWIQHFIDYVKPTPMDPVVLILDGHGTHIRNIDVIVRARENGVIIVCLPPHTSHKLQPMDVSFMSPFKAYYSQEVETWLSNNPYRSVTCYQIGELMGKAYAKCATLQIASKGFSKCGILPFDRNKFLESDFIDVEEHQPETLLDLGQPQEAESPVDFQGPIASTSNAPNAFLGPVTATTKTLEEDMQKKKIVSPFVLKPPPKLPEVTSKPKRGRPAGKSAIITSSPYKNNLEKQVQQAKNKEQQLQEKKKAKSKGEKRMKGKQTEEYKPIKKKRTIPSCEQLPFKKTTKRKIFDVGTQDETSDEDPDIPLVSTDDEDSADEECVYCCQPYKEDKCGEQWIRCIKCLRWAHELCCGADKKAWKTFTCDFCQKHL